MERDWERERDGWGNGRDCKGIDGQTKKYWIGGKMENGKQYRKLKMPKGRDACMHGEEIARRIHRQMESDWER